MMALGNQAKALALVLAYEGGYSDHPEDKGGPTIRGVPQAVYDATRQSRGQATQSVRHITADEIASIYDQQYWDRANCEQPEPRPAHRSPDPTTHAAAMSNRTVTAMSRIRSRSVGFINLKGANP